MPWVSRDKDWPKTPISLSYRLNEVIPNLQDIGIIVERVIDKHRKSDRITIGTDLCLLLQTKVRMRVLAGKRTEMRVNKLLEICTSPQSSPQNIYNMFSSIRRICVRKSIILLWIRRFPENPIFLRGLRVVAGTCMVLFNGMGR